MSDSYTQKDKRQNQRQSTSTRYQSPFLISQPNEHTDNSMSSNNMEFNDQNEFNDIFSASHQNMLMSQYSQRPHQKFLYISAISKNRDNILPKNCAATNKGQEQYFSNLQRKMTTQMHFQAKKAVRSSKAEMLRKSEMLVRELDDLNQNFVNLNELKQRKSRLCALSPGKNMVTNMAEIDVKTANRIKSKLSEMKINVGKEEEDTPEKSQRISRRKLITKSSTPKIQEDLMGLSQINFLSKPVRGQSYFQSQPSSTKNQTQLQVQSTTRNTKQLYQSLLAFEKVGCGDILNQSGIKLPQTQTRRNQNISILSPVSSRKDNRSQLLNQSSRNLFSKTSVMMSPKEHMSLEGSLQAFGQNETMLALQKFRKAEANSVFEGVVLTSEQDESSPKNKQQKIQNAKKFTSPKRQKNSVIKKLNQKKLGLSSNSNARSSDLGIFSQNHAFGEDQTPTPGVQSQTNAKPTTPYQQPSPRFQVRELESPTFDQTATRAIFAKGSAVEITTEELDNNIQEDILDSPALPQKHPRKTAHFENPLQQDAIFRRGSQAVRRDGHFDDLGDGQNSQEDVKIVGLPAAYKQTGLAQTQPLKLSGQRMSPKKLRIEKLQSKMKKLGQEEAPQAPPTLREAKQKTPRRVQPALQNQVDSPKKSKIHKSPRSPKKSPRPQETQVELTFRGQEVGKRSFTSVKSPQIQKGSQVITIDETFEDMHNNAMSMIAYQGLSQKVMNANEGSTLQMDTFQELGIGDRYKEMLDENIKYRAARRKRIAAAERAASQSQGSQNSPRMFLEPADLEPEEILYAAWIDDVDCMSKLRFLHKQARILKHDLSLALRPIHLPDFHDPILASPPDTAPKGHKFELVENVPVNCKIKVKGFYGPLKILCEVDIDDQQRAAQRLFIQNQIKQNTRKVSPNKKKGKQDSSKVQETSKDFSSVAGDTQGKATFLTAPIMAESEKERDQSPDADDKPTPKISLAQKKRMEKFKFAHDLSIFASINPRNADPHPGKCDLQVDCKHQEKFFFKFGNHNNPDNIGLPFVDEQFQQEYVYLTMLSDTGCKVVIKAQFSEKIEVGGKEKAAGGAMFGDAAKEEEVGLAAIKAAKLAEQETALRAARYVKELQEYYKEQTKPPEGINDNFVGTNKIKYCDLQLLQEERQQYELMMRVKQLEAQNRKSICDKLKRQTKKQYLAHWDDYRALKFELVKDYCRVLKRQKRLKEYASHKVLCFAIHNFARYFIEQRQKRHSSLRTIFLAIKIKQRYRFQHCRPYGLDMKFRIRQELRRRLIVWPTMMLTSEAIQMRAKSVLNAFFYDSMPALKIVSGFGKYKSSVSYIEQTRKKMLFSRLYKKQYYEKVFEREIKFLTDFFGTGKAKNKNILRGLKKINQVKIEEAIQNYQRKLICDYLVLTRSDNITKLKVRIKINQTILAEHYTAKAYEQATGKKYKGQCCNNLHSGFEENLRKDEQLLKKLMQREKQLTIESYAIEEALFSGDSSQLVYDHETHIKSFESYQAKIQAKIKKTTKKIKKNMQDALRQALSKKKASNQDISLDQTQGEDQKDQGDQNPILNNMLNQIGKKSSNPDPSRKQSKKNLKGADKNKIQAIKIEEVQSPPPKPSPQKKKDDDSDLEEQIKCERRLGPDAIKISREDIHRILLKYSINGMIDLDGVLEETREQNKNTQQTIETDY